jgi:hypothetical protein
MMDVSRSWAKERPPDFVLSGGPRAKQFRSFEDLAEKLKMDVHDLMRQPRRSERCDAKARTSRALVKGLAQELNMFIGLLSGASLNNRLGQYQKA